MRPPIVRRHLRAGIEARSSRICAVRILAVAAAVALPATAAAQDIGLPIGSTPAAAQVEDLDGNAVDLAQYVGRKPVLIEFWATWCGVCRALEPQITAAHQRFGQTVEFLIVGVAVNQTQRQIRRHLEGHPLPGRFLYDAKGAAVRAYMAPTTSYVVILDAAGKVVYTGSGEDQSFTEALARVTG